MRDGWIGALVLLVAAGGCARQRPVVPLELGGAPRALVLPFRLGGLLDERGAYVPQQGAAPLPEDLGASAAGTLASQLAANGVQVVDVIAGPNATRDALAAAGAAREAGANLAIIGAILRYVQREGTALGATAPASVAYRVALVRAADGAIVTISDFDYTQQPLSANVLDLPRFLQAGGRWMTREEILDGALRETAQRLAAVIRGEAPPSRMIHRGHSGS